MRYETLIYFQRIIPGEYDKTTGDYSRESIQEVPKYAAVMDTGAQMLQLVYGKLKQGSLTIQIQGRHDLPFDKIRLGNKQYQVDSVRNLRSKQVFVVSEVQSWALP